MRGLLPRDFVMRGVGHGNFSLRAAHTSGDACWIGASPARLDPGSAPIVQPPRSVTGVDVPSGALTDLLASTAAPPCACNKTTAAVSKGALWFPSGDGNQGVRTGGVRSVLSNRGAGRRLGRVNRSGMREHRPSEQRRTHGKVGASRTGANRRGKGPL